MLQLRLENEQFNSLPSIYNHSRSRTDFITTDRPDSSQLVDLHVFIIPKSVWKNVRHLVQNEAMDDAISAGFVRVSSDMILFDLRRSIEQLCGTEDYFPRDFIFLRSVGRYMTRVKSRQENELSVKNYRPPQTAAAEIYLLEGHHEEYAFTPSPSPALSSASYLFGNRNRQRYDFDSYARSTPRLSHHYPQKSSRTEKVNTSDLLSHISSTGRKSWTKLTPVSTDETSSKELSKLKKEQERLRRRQAELERMRRAAEGKKGHTEREENERRLRRQEKTQAERDEEERRRRRLQEKIEADRRQKKTEADRRQEKIEADRRQEKIEADRRRLEQKEVAATKIQASFRGFKYRQEFHERRRNIDNNNNSRISSSKTDTTLKKNEEKTYIFNDDDELSDGSQILSRSSIIESTSDVDSNPSRPETRTIKVEDKESIHSNSSSSKKSERKLKSNMSSYSKTDETIHSPKHSSMKNKIDDDDDENIRSATVTKIRHPEEDSLPITTPDINDEFELDRLDADVKRRLQLEEERRKTRGLAKRRPHDDTEMLRIRLQELRTQYAGLEKIRDEVIKHLKYIHSRVTLRRKDARDMWKKKYFTEKKKTPPTEGLITQLKTDLEQIHSKVVQTIDNECKHFGQTGHLKEAEVGNCILQITRAEHEIQDIRHQVDQAKLRLTTDIKLRNQAENECRTLKHELTQAKMNLNHIKNRVRV